jgi:galactose mutarotase-like enzyme
MLHTIENDFLICTIESVGAEVRSLKEKATGREYIWQIDNSVWGSSSPVLFPAIGKIKSDKVVYQGKSYAMSKHGIIRHNDQLIFKQDGDSACSFTLQSSAATYQRYPYSFLFSVRYQLMNKRLLMSYHIENLGEVPMYFACGGHTAYACPLDDGLKLSDYVVEFPAYFDFMAGTLGNSGLLSDRKRKIAASNGMLQLSDTLFLEDALIFTDINFDSLRLKKRNEDKGIFIRFDGYPNLALWSKPGADFLCIEPWLGLPDSEKESIDITQKSSYKRIESKAQFSISIETELE